MKKSKNKIHWVRKFLSYPIWCSNIKQTWYYDMYGVCGRYAIGNSTHIKKKVTCKKCLKIMKSKGLLP